MFVMFVHVSFMLFLDYVNLLFHVALRITLFNMFNDVFYSNDPEYVWI